MTGGASMAVRWMAIRCWRCAGASRCRACQERGRIACIGHERADLVVAGCAILESILQHWPGGTVRVADRGIREGILRTLMTP